MAFRIGLGVLLVVLLILGVLAFRSVSVVLSQPDNYSEVAVSADSSLISELLTIVDQKQTMLMQVESTGRNPFKDPPPKYIKQAEVQLQPPDVVLLKALLYTEESPCIQISVNGSRSDWLYLGDVFHRWTVEVITSKSATLSKDNQSITLAIATG